MNLTYSCEICNGINHLARLHCQTCNAIPTRYSFLRRPIIFKCSEEISAVVPVNRAKGCEMQVIRQTKSTFRTVPLDYYATDLE